MALEARAADGERDLDVAAGGARIGAGLVRPLHQLEGVRAADFGRIEVEGGREAEAAAAEGTDPDARCDARAA
jgi:hypothetical protein